MKNLKEMLDKIVKSSMYSDKEYEVLMKKVDSFVFYINDELRRRKVKAEALVGGSFAKGTLLKNDFDCDIFVRFKNEKDMPKLLQILEKYKPEIIHGSRDYYNLKYNGINYEIVPVLWIEKLSEMKNTTDVSVFHVKWIKEQMNKNPDLRKEIILAKLFCKAQKVYGAESYIRGFSGHVLDILVSYYGSFIDFVKNAAKWKGKTIIDFYNFHKGNAISNLNYSKTYSPLIVIDPIQPSRNASASMSEEKFDAFVNSCKEFIKKPSYKFFKIKPMKIPKGKNVICVYGSSLKGNRDVVGSKILKVYEYILLELGKNDFKVLNSDWEWDKKSRFTMFFRLERTKLSQFKEWCGPPVNEKSFVLEFKRKYKRTYEKNGRVCAFIRRKYPDARKMLGILIKKDYVRDRVKSIKIKCIK